MGGLTKHMPMTKMKLDDLSMTKMKLGETKWRPNPTNV